MADPNGAYNQQGTPNNLRQRRTDKSTRLRVVIAVAMARGRVGAQVTKIPMDRALPHKEEEVAGGSTLLTECLETISLRLR